MQAAAARIDQERRLKKMPFDMQIGCRAAKP
jgi:hypothetical protein